MQTIFSTIQMRAYNLQDPLNMRVKHLRRQQSQKMRRARRTLDQSQL